MSAEAWNEQVDAFDVAGLVRQLAATGTKYLLFTVGQNSGHYGAPNATYDRLVGIGYVRELTAKGGVVTWDVPIQKSGLIPEPFVVQLRSIGRARVTASE